MYYNFILHHNFKGTIEVSKKVKHPSPSVTAYAINSILVFFVLRKTSDIRWVI